MTWIDGGDFRMGDERYYPEERPVHRVTVDGVWIDTYPVTNRTFARFVADTGHVTFAELLPALPAGCASARADRLHDVTHRLSLYQAALDSPYVTHSCFSGRGRTLVA